VQHYQLSLTKQAKSDLSWVNGGWVSVLGVDTQNYLQAYLGSYTDLITVSNFWINYKSVTSFT